MASRATWTSTSGRAAASIPRSEPHGHLSLAVDRLKSGNRMEDRELRRRIDAQRFPLIEGDLGQMVQNGSDGSYRVSGDVTFRGVSRHYKDLMTMEMIDERTISLTGSSRFDIRDFGMQPPKVLVLKVEPEVDVKVAIVAVEDDAERTGRVGGSGRPCVWAYRGSCGRYRRPIGIWRASTCPA